MTYTYALEFGGHDGGAYVVRKHDRPTGETFGFERDARRHVEALNANALTVVRKLVITIEQRDDGVCMVSTEGNPLGDWERRTGRSGIGGVSDALEHLDIATGSTDDEPLWQWADRR